MRALICGACLLIVLTLPAAGQPEQDWVDTYDGGGAYLDEALVSLIDGAGNVVLAGISHDGIDGGDALVCKRDRETGEMIWDCRVTAFDTNDMAVTDMAWDPAGDLIVAGYVVGCEG